jgi:hypothetical protein
MTTILPSLLLLEHFLKQQKRKGTDGVRVTQHKAADLPTGRSIIPLSVLLYDISTLRKVYELNNQKLAKEYQQIKLKMRLKLLKE